MDGLMDGLLLFYLTVILNSQCSTSLSLPLSVCLPMFLVIVKLFFRLLFLFFASKTLRKHVYHVTSQYITLSGLDQGLGLDQGQVTAIYQNHFQCRNLDCQNYGNDHPCTVKTAATVKMPVRKYDTPDGSAVRERTVLYRTTTLCCVFDDDTVQQVKHE